MIVLKLKGGLGNQLFQYSFGYFLSKKLERKLMLDTSYYDCFTLDTKRNYELSQYPIHFDSFYSGGNFLSNLLNRFSTRQINEGSYSESTINSLEGLPIIFVEGYWQSESYFKEYSVDIKNMFNQFSSQKDKYCKLHNQITSVESASIHIRRGDYVNNRRASMVHGVCSMDFYQKSIKLLEDISERIHFFVFTDDPEWVKNNFPLVTYTLISNQGLNHFEELSLMSTCKYNIIANSSFSWWAAYLNENSEKKVIAPKNWYLSDINTDILIPADWLVL